MNDANKIGRAPITEDMLAMPRQKERSLVTSLGYRISRIGDVIFGKRRMLKLFLNGSRLLWRFAFERSGEIFDADFHNTAKALTEAYLRRWIEDGDTVIDIGCGVGRWCQIAAKYARSVVGIDYSAQLIAAARLSTTAKNVEYLIGDVTTDLDGREFDLAIFVHVIEHIQAPDEILKAMRRVSRKLIVEVPDLESDPLNLVRLEMGCQFYSDADHVREYTQEILNDQLERTGWTVLENRKSGGAVLAVAKRRAD